LQLGDTWAVRIVTPEWSDVYSDEWAKYIPGGPVFKPLYVTWYTDFDATEGIHTFKIKYFDDEVSQLDFYNKLEVGAGYQKEISNK
jgi:hypothetical protein